MGRSQRRIAWAWGCGMSEILMSNLLSQGQDGQEEEKPLREWTNSGRERDSSRTAATSVVDRPADTNDRRTPRWFFEQCEARYGPFDCDVAATKENRLCGSHIADALSALGWSLRNWCNPPYGPAGTIEKWIAKAREQRDRFGCRTLMLLPADTSTRWFHDVSRTELIELIPFRLKFDSPEAVQNNSAKFGSVLVWIAPKIRRVRA